jgi:hypothetical protein
MMTGWGLKRSGKQVADGLDGGRRSSGRRRGESSEAGAMSE